MKNFSELLATDLNLDFKLELTPFHSALDVSVCINGQTVYDDLLAKDFKYATQLSLLNPISIRICIQGKDYALDSQSAVLLKTIKIDDFDLIPNWTHLSSYKNDHNYTEPTTHLGFNGEWQLDIPEPFYRWKHKITGQGWLLTP